MKFNSNYVEGNCINLKGCQCNPCMPNYQNCNPNPYPPPPMPYPQQPFQCPPAQCGPCFQAPSCGYINFQIPYSFIYLFAGYLLGNINKD